LLTAPASDGTTNLTVVRNVSGWLGAAVYTVGFAAGNGFYQLGGRFDSLNTGAKSATYVFPDYVKLVTSGGAGR
jgi:hypothetical protein